MVSLSPDPLPLTPLPGTLLAASFETKTVTLPIRAAGSGGATAADYSGIPANLVFAPGDTEKSFTVTLTDDDVDDDGESLTLSFGAESNIKSGGANETATVAIRDDDDPAVTVSFGASTYTAAEGGTATVTVTLSADPERTVTVPLTKTEQGGATSADYSGVPASVTFDAGQTSKTITASPKTCSAATTSTSPAPAWASPPSCTTSLPTSCGRRPRAGTRTPSWS